MALCPARIARRSAALFANIDGVSATSYPTESLKRRNWGSGGGGGRRLDSVDQLKSEFALTNF